MDRQAKSKSRTLAIQAPSPDPIASLIDINSPLALGATDGANIQKHPQIEVAVIALARLLGRQLAREFVAGDPRELIKMPNSMSFLNRN